MNPRLLQLLSCAIFCAVGPLLIFLNKYLLTTVGFRYPAFLSGLGVGCSCACSVMLVKLRVVKLEHADKISGRFYCTRILPIGLGLAGTLHFGNMAYFHLSVAYIQMLKAFAPAMLLGMLIIMGLEQPSRQLVTAIAIIVLGTTVSAFGEIRFSWLGTGIMLFAEFCECARLAMQQVLLKNLKFSVIEGLFYMTPAALVFLVLLSAWYEFPQMAEDRAFEKMSANPVAFGCAAVLGFGVNLGSVLVVKHCSSLTLRVLGTFRNLMIVFVSHNTLGDPVSGLQLIGYGFATAGVVLYQQAKASRVSVAAKEKSNDSGDEEKAVSLLLSLTGERTAPEPGPV